MEDETTFIERGPSIRKSEAVTAVIVMVCWITLFLGGSLINTSPYRKAVVDSPFYALDGWLLVMLFYTLTNLAFLCALSSIMGGLYKHLSRNESSAHRLKVTPYLIQGFVVYMLLISGMLIFSDAPFTDLNSDKYIRLAGTASMFSFVAGFNPRLFAALIEKFKQSSDKR